MTHTITTEQAANILTIATLRNLTAGNGGFPLSEEMKAQNRAEIARIEKEVPAALLRAAATAAAARDEATSRVAATQNWLNAQTITD